MRDQELWLQVMQRFPRIDKEKTCRMEREMRNQARESYYKRLYDAKSKEDILERCDEDAAKVAGQVQ